MNSIAATLDPAPWRHFHSRPDLRLVLAVAVALHALLVFLPVAGKRPAPLPPTVTVDLENRMPAPVQPVEEAIAAPEPVPEQAQAAPSAVLAAPPRPAMAPVETEPAAPGRPAATTALLLESANYFTLPQSRPERTERIPGVAVIPKLPDNLSRPVLPLIDTPFDELYLDGEDELIDQWMSPDGVAEAVVRTARGEVLCGRMQSWDPMNPLVEHVAMWRTCGTGGKRNAAASPFRARD